MMGIITGFLNDGWRVVFMTAANASEHCADLDLDGLTTESVALNCSSFDERIAAISPDVVVFDRFMTEEQFSARVRGACPDAMRILNTEDLHSLRHQRHEQVKSGQKSDNFPGTFSDMTIREVAAILRSDLTLIISDREMNWLQSNFPIPREQLLHLPLLTTGCRTPLPDFHARSDFVFIGNFRHAPNWDAVLQLQQLWPAVRKRLPGINLNIYGAYPPKKAMALHNPARGFHVRGWAENADETIASHRIMLAPVRFGAGVKGKLVKAMQCGTPSVTTTTGAEGIGTHKTWPGMVTHTNEDFVESAVTLYTDENRWLKASEDGKRFAATHFDSVKHQRMLLGEVNARRERLHADRRQWFLQAMVWHQSLRASQFMSQWIEAKNKHHGQ